jgi:hypothetical protein
MKEREPPFFSKIRTVILNSLINLYTSVYFMCFAAIVGLDAGVSSFALINLSEEILNYSNSITSFSSSQSLIVTNALSLISTISFRTKSLLIQEQANIYSSTVQIISQSLKLLTNSNTTFYTLLNSTGSANSSTSLTESNTLFSYIEMYAELLQQLGKICHIYDGKLLFLK